MALEPFNGEYWILYCLERSSSDPTGVSRRDTVKKAAKLAVYEAIIMKPKSHHVAATSRPDNRVLLLLVAFRHFPALFTNTFILSHFLQLCYASVMLRFKCSQILQFFLQVLEKSRQKAKTNGDIWKDSRKTLAISCLTSFLVLLLLLEGSKRSCRTISTL